MADMRLILACSVLILAVFASMAASESKYSAFKNTKAEDILKEKPFRAAKVNLVWEKAKKRLDKDEMSDIFHELRFYDQATMDYKRKSAETDNYDENGEHEAVLRQTLMQILNVRFYVFSPTICNYLIAIGCN